MSVVIAATARAAEADEVPLGEIIKVLQAELADLAETADTLQEMTGKLVQATGGQLGSALIKEAQSLDTMFQRLSALSTFLGFLAPTVPTNWAVDPRAATSMLTLANLAGKLVAAGSDHNHNHGTSAGDLDLF